jgi:RHS repeat-associated protein
VQSIDYSYDAAGNRRTKTDSTGTTTYSYDANSRLVSAGGVTFTYDANGNLRSKQAGALVNSYQYDALNRLRAATMATGASAQYSYDALNNRVSRTGSAGTTAFVVDPFGHGGMRLAVEETTCCDGGMPLPLAARTSFRGHGLAQVLREVDGVGVATDYFYAGAGIIGRDDARGSHFYLTDGQHSTRALTDEAGTVTDAYDYDAFGNPLSHDGSTANDHLYTGQQLDPVTGLYYLRARDYDPLVGRLTTMDPYGGDGFHPPSLHPYQYAYNDPINRHDPSGAVTLSEFAVSVAITGVLGALVDASLAAYSGKAAGDVAVAAVRGFFIGAAAEALVLGAVAVATGGFAVAGAGALLAPSAVQAGVTATLTTAGTLIVRALPDLVEATLKSQRQMLQKEVDLFAKSYRQFLSQGSEVAETTLRRQIDKVDELNRCAFLLFMRRGLWKVGLQVANAAGDDFSAVFTKQLEDSLNNSSCKSWS